MNKIAAIFFFSLLVVFIAGPLHACSKTYPHAEGYDEDIAEIVEMIDEARNSEPIYTDDINTELDYFKPWCGLSGNVVREITTIELKGSEIKNDLLYVYFYTISTTYTASGEASNNTDYLPVCLEQTDDGWRIIDIKNQI